MSKGREAGEIGTRSKADSHFRMSFFFLKHIKVHAKTICLPEMALTDLSSGLKAWSISKQLQGSIEV
jgi:hypothetical protein